MSRRKIYVRLLILIALIGLLILALALTQPIKLRADSLTLPTEPVADYIRANPGDVAVYCSVEGQPQMTVTHNADEPFQLASAYKLLVLAEFGRQIDAGLVDPDQTVPLDAVNAYWLPGTDGGAHMNWMATLDEDQETVTLAEIAEGMIVFSSNANPDYLLTEHLGYDGFAALHDQLEMDHTPSLEGTMLGLFLLLDNHETGIVDLGAITPGAAGAERERLQRLYLSDPDWRDAQIAHRAERINREDFDEADYLDTQRAFFAAYGPQATAQDMSRVINAIYEGEVYTDASQTLLQAILNWLLEQNPANRDLFTALGTKGGSLPGILTGVWHVQPVDGPIIQLVVFYRDLPTADWLEWTTSFRAQMLETQVFSDGCAVFGDLFAEETPVGTS